MCCHHPVEADISENAEMEIYGRNDGACGESSNVYKRGEI